MFKPKSVICLAMAAFMLPGCGVFGSKAVDERLENELSVLALDRKILEKRISLAEERITSLQNQMNEIAGNISGANGGKAIVPQIPPTQVEKISDNLSEQKTVPPASTAQNTTVSPQRPAEQKTAPPVKEVPKTQFVPPDKSSTESGAYKMALERLQAGNYKQAETMFKDFMQKYPRSTLIPNAGYWLGEAYYGQKRYDDAIIAFQGVVRKSPRHHKAADSLLKIGYSYERLGDRPNARFYLEQLVKNYPRAESAPLAGRLLARLK